MGRDGVTLLMIVGNQRYANKAQVRCRCAVGGEAFAFSLELEVATFLIAANANIDAEGTIGTP